MKVYVHTDIEGVAGWVFFSQPERADPFLLAHQQRMNRLLTAEVAAACQAALDAGAQEVWVNDAHGPAYNIQFEDLPDACQIMHGRGGYFDAWLSQLDDSFDAMVCIGQHAMAGTPHSVCPHSLWHLTANGESLKLSETTMAAALAATRGVPTVFVSGDDKICAEVTGAIPGIHAAVVKWGIAGQNARSLMPRAAQRLIYDGVTQALKDRRNIQPYTLAGPFAVNISNRDPAERILPEDVSGDELWETVHRALNTTSYGHFGQDPLEDGSYRWPRH